MDLITNLNLKLPQAGYIPKEEKATKRWSSGTHRLWDDFSRQKK